MKKDRMPNSYKIILNSLEDMLERGDGRYYYKEMPYYERRKTGDLGVSPKSVCKILKIFKENNIVNYKNIVWILGYDVTYEDNTGKKYKELLLK